MATFGRTDITNNDGYNSIGVSDGNQSRIFLNLKTLTETGIVESISVPIELHTEAGEMNFILGIYNEILYGGVSYPNILLGQTAVEGVAGDFIGWKTVPLITPTQLNAGNYYLAICADYTNGQGSSGRVWFMGKYSGETETTRYKNLYIPTLSFPEQWIDLSPSFSINSSIYATYTIPAPPVTNFTATPLTGRVPLTVAFTDTSTNTPTSWLWDFGDGETSTEQNPTHIYNGSGYYTVTLTATNSAGSDIEVKTSYIRVFRFPRFNISKPMIPILVVD